MEGEAPLVEKAQQLLDALADARLRLQAQSDSVGILRGRIKAIDRGVGVIGGRAQLLRENLERPAPEPALRTEAPAAPLVALGWTAPRENFRWAQALPYLLILAASLGYGLKDAPAAPQAAAATPVPAAIPKQDAPPPAENDSLADANDAVLDLVFHYHLPGARGTILNRMGFKDESFVMKSPWQIERLDRNRYLVVYRSGNDAKEGAVYEFEADLANKTVSLSPETAQMLASAAERVFSN